MNETQIGNFFGVLRDILSELKELNGKLDKLTYHPWKYKDGKGYEDKEQLHLMVSQQGEVEVTGSVTSYDPR